MLKKAVETRVASQIPEQSQHLGVVWFACTVVNQSEVGREGKTLYQRGSWLTAGVMECFGDVPSRDWNFEDADRRA